MKSKVRWRGVTVAEDRVGVRVDEPGHDGRAVGIDDDVGVAGQAAPDGLDPAVAR